jgi:hypothetical protein
LFENEKKYLTHLLSLGEEPALRSRVGGRGKKEKS